MALVILQFWTCSDFTNVTTVLVWYKESTFVIVEVVHFNMTLFMTCWLCEEWTLIVIGFSDQYKDGGKWPRLESIDKNKLTNCVIEKFFCSITTYFSRDFNDSFQMNQKPKRSHFFIHQTQIFDIKTLALPILIKTKIEMAGK